MSPSLTNGGAKGGEAFGQLRARVTPSRSPFTRETIVRETSPSGLDDFDAIIDA